MRTQIYLANPIPKGLGNKGCAACDGLLSVAPDGSALPDASFPDPVGNLREDRFTPLWQSAWARVVVGIAIISPCVTGRVRSTGERWASLD